LNYLFAKYSPELAYVTNHLLLPKKYVRESAIAADLTVWDEKGEPITMCRRVNQHLEVPRQFVSSQEYGRWGFKFVDLRPRSYRYVDFRSAFRPNSPVQYEAQEALRKTGSGGLLNLSCGKGKTALALDYIAWRKVPALIVVHNETLIDQWLERIGQFLQFSGGVGVVQGSSIHWEHPITIAMLQTLAFHAEEWPIEFQQYPGVIIFDEAHKVGAQILSRAAPIFWGDRLGLTATETRPDGRQVVYYNHVGPVFYSNKEQDMIPTIMFVALPTSCDLNDAKTMDELVDTTGKVCLPKVLSWLGAQPARNQFIAGYITDLMQRGRRCLALSHSIEMLQQLHSLIPESGIITGNVDRHDRYAALKERMVVFATLQIAAEGLDQQKLDTLLLLTPFKSRNWVEQAVGRIQRFSLGKQDPLVVIFQDDLVPKCKEVCRKLKTSLRQLGLGYNITSIREEEWEKPKS